jgi:16S rRNA (guanine1516-N2)-methyltransferase
MIESQELTIDFLNDHINYSRKNHRGKSEIIARALGAGKGVKSVLDLTCGLAQDAFFLAQLGFQVRAFERSEKLYSILSKALEKAKAEAPERADLQRLSIEFMDSRDYLKSAQFRDLDKMGMALYLDPMFPEKKKSALPRKEMQIFRTLVGDDSDAGELFSLALKSSCDRVVVKRPLKAEPMSEGVVHRFEGTTVRYDLYIPQSLTYP